MKAEAINIKDYGSQNPDEESTFIRRVVAPPKRAQQSRRNAKRLAAVGASAALLAVGAVCTYVSLPGQSAVQTVTTQSLESNVAQDVPDDDEVDIFVPAFSDYDIDGNGIVTNDEYVSRLGFNRDEALKRLAASPLSEDEKKVIASKLDKNLQTEVKCAKTYAKGVRD